MPPSQKAGSDSGAKPAAKAFDSEAALLEVEKHISHFRVTEQDFETLDRVLKVNPNDCFARFLLARCFERRGLVDLATEQHNLVEKLEAKPEEILRRLRHHIEAGELSQAFNMRTLVSNKANPDDPNLQLLEGFFHQEMGAKSNAEFIYNKLLTRKDCPLGAATALAGLRMDEKKWAEAIELIDRDLKVNPNYVPGLTARSICSLALGNAKDVVALLKKPLSEHPFNRMLNLLMYQAYRHEGRTQEALACALRNLAGSDYITYYEDAMQRVKDTVKVLPRKVSARVVAEQEQEIDRTDYAMKFHFFLGWCYMDLRWLNEASDQTQKAIDMVPEFEPNWYQMGRIKETLAGDLPGAAECFKKAHELQHSDGKALYALKRVKARLRNSDRDLSMKIKNIIRGR